jgi:hypothetical protein
MDANRRPGRFLLTGSLASQAYDWSPFMPNTTESDWKTIKGLHDQLLEALCDKIHQECGAIIASREENAHARYLQLYEHVQKSDRLLGDCFDDLKRSNLPQKILHMKRAGILKPEYERLLSPDMREWLDEWG